MPEQEKNITKLEAEGSATNAQPGKVSARPICGVVRPIADMGDYSAAHWLAVHSIVSEAADAVGFDVRLVSESDSAGIILNHIVTNLYTDRIVICDVSGRNPNVMFELGMRIAFEKPVIVIADDATPFSFDISPLKHYKYPRSLRYSDIVKFKKDLGAAILSTLDSFDDPAYRGYLQQFGPIEATQLSTQQVSVEGLATDIAELRRAFSSIEGLIRDGGGSEKVRAHAWPTSSGPDLMIQVPLPQLEYALSIIEEGGEVVVLDTTVVNSELARLSLITKQSGRYSLSFSKKLRILKDSGTLSAAFPISRLGLRVVNDAGIPETMFTL